MSFPDAHFEEDPRLFQETLEEQLRRTLPDLERILTEIQTDPDSVIPPPAKVRATVGTAHLFGDQKPEQVTQAMEQERARLLEFARMAVEALRRGQDVATPLTAEERRGAQALLTFLTRPALFVQNNVFVEPPPLWREALDRRRPLIQRCLPSVGRIEMDGHPERKPWAGTGWMAGPGLLMTNRHVVREFAEPETPETGGQRVTRWRIKPGMTVRVDFGEEWEGQSEGEQRSHDIPVDGLIRVHPLYDLALVPVAATARGSEKRSLPPPLTLAAQGDAIVEGRKVYVAGYPARDGRNRELENMERLFEAIFNVKRLQPGQVMQVLMDKGVLLHDCSTLGGNSGSCVVDLDTNRVVGLHYAGFHRQANLAVALWTLVDDPLLREAGVRFGQA